MEQAGCVQAWNIAMRRRSKSDGVRPSTMPPPLPIHQAGRSDGRSEYGDFCSPGLRWASDRKGPVYRVRGEPLFTLWCTMVENARLDNVW